MSILFFLFIFIFFGGVCRVQGVGVWVIGLVGLEGFKV